MDADVQPSLRIAVFVLNAAGCAFLSVLVISVSLSQRLHRRDPVVNNFLYTWILLSALASFDELAVLSNRDLGDATDVRESVLTMITMLSTLNLSIHLWYIMRAAYHQSSHAARKLRTFALVVTPYIFGLFPLVSLFAPSSGTTVVGLLYLIVSSFTPIADIIILFYYWRWYRMTKKAKLSGVISLSFFIRLLAFSLYQLFYTVLLILGATSGGLSIWSVAFKILQNMFPLLAFCVLGLHTDVLQLWFPCVRKRGATRTVSENVDSVTSSDNVLVLAQEIDGDGRHLLERRGEEQDSDKEETTEETMVNTH